MFNQHCIQKLNGSWVSSHFRKQCRPVRPVNAQVLKLLIYLRESQITPAVYSGLIELQIFKIPSRMKVKPYKLGQNHQYDDSITI